MNLYEAKKVLKQNGFKLIKENSEESFNNWLERQSWAKDYDEVIPAIKSNGEFHSISNYYIVCRNNKYNVLRATMGGLRDTSTKGHLISNVWFDKITVRDVDHFKDTCTYNVVFGPARLTMDEFGSLGRFGHPKSEDDLIERLRQAGYEV